MPCIALGHIINKVILIPLITISNIGIVDISMYNLVESSLLNLDSLKSLNMFLILKISFLKISNAIDINVLGEQEQE